MREQIDLESPGDVREQIDLENTGDVREPIDFGDAPSPASPPPSTSAAEAEAPAALTFQMRGWARTRGSITTASYERPDDGSIGAPLEPMLGEQQLFLELSVRRGRWFEAVASGLLWYSMAAHDEETLAGPVQHSSRTLLEPSLRELYVGVIGPKASLRMGKQRIAWGNSDAFQVNDVLNPRDLRDPLLAESDVLHVPTVASRLDATLGRVNVELVWVPFFVPDRVDVYGTNWSFLQPDAPAGLRGAFARLSNSFDPSLREPTQLLLRQTSLPLDDLTGSQLGARVDWSAAGFDVSHYYQYGYTFSPALRVDPALLGTIVTTNWRTAGSDQIAGLLAARGSEALSSTYERRHHVGLSVQRAVGSVLVRGEAATDSAQIFSDRNLLSVVRPTAQAVLGLEYQPGEPGKAIILEAQYQRILGQKPPALLGANVDGVAASAVLRWTFWDKLEAELRTVTSLRPLGTMLRPQLTYKLHTVELRLGMVLLSGERYSSAWYFRRNTSAYAMVKVPF